MRRKTTEPSRTAVDDSIRHGAGVLRFSDRVLRNAGDRGHEPNLAGPTEGKPPNSMRAARSRNFCILQLCVVAIALVGGLSVLTPCGHAEPAHTSVSNATADSLELGDAGLDSLRVYRLPFTIVVSLSGSGRKPCHVSV